MRAILIVSLLIAATAITGAAQSTARGLGLPRGTQVTAEQMVSSGKGEAVLSGNVTITTPSTTATADRAIFREGSQTFELEGHVQLRVSASPK